MAIWPWLAKAAKAIVRGGKKILGGLFSRGIDPFAIAGDLARKSIGGPGQGHMAGRMSFDYSPGENVPGVPFDMRDIPT